MTRTYNKPKYHGRSLAQTRKQLHIVRKNNHQAFKDLLRENSPARFGIECVIGFAGFGFMWLAFIAFLLT